jgi:hypothetical protein
MRYTDKLKTLLFFSLVLGSKISAQSINLYTFNNGGGSNSTLEWSIGESASIAYFTSAAYTLNTGVLQPLIGNLTSIPYGLTVFGKQISIGPNPTSNILKIKALFYESGNLSFQLLDSKSSLLLTQDAGFIFNSYEKELFLNNFPSGVFYIRIYFKTTSGIVKTGIYKIIKL